MEVTGTNNSFLFTSPFTVSGGNKATVNEAKVDLNSGGQPRRGVKDLVFQSLNIVRRRVPVFEGVAHWRVSVWAMPSTLLRKSQKEINFPSLMILNETIGFPI